MDKYSLFFCSPIRLEWINTYTIVSWINWYPFTLTAHPSIHPFVCRTIDRSLGKCQTSSLIAHPSSHPLVYLTMHSSVCVCVCVSRSAYRPINWSSRLINHWISAVLACPSTTVTPQGHRLELSDVELHELVLPSQERTIARVLTFTLGGKSKKDSHSRATCLRVKTRCLHCRVMSSLCLPRSFHFSCLCLISPRVSEMEWPAQAFVVSVLCCMLRQWRGHHVFFCFFLNFFPQH